MSLNVAEVSRLGFRHFKFKVRPQGLDKFKVRSRVLQNARPYHEVTSDT